VNAGFKTSLFRCGCSQGLIQAIIISPRILFKIAIQSAVLYIRIELWASVGHAGAPEPTGKATPELDRKLASYTSLPTNKVLEGPKAKYSGSRSYGRPVLWDKTWGTVLIWPYPNLLFILCSQMQKHLLPCWDRELRNSYFTLLKDHLKLILCLTMLSSHRGSRLG
jgi:hypothetical protein